MVIEEAAYVPGKQGAICLNLHLGIEMVFLHHMHQSSNQGIITAFTAVSSSISTASTSDA